MSEVKKRSLFTQQYFKRHPCFQGLCRLYTTSKFSSVEHALTWLWLESRYMQAAEVSRHGEMEPFRSAAQPAWIASSMLVTDAWSLLQFPAADEQNILHMQVLTSLSLEDATCLGAAATAIALTWISQFCKAVHSCESWSWQDAPSDHSACFSPEPFLSSNFLRLAST